MKNSNLNVPHRRKCSLIWLKRRPVTSKIAGSSPVFSVEQRPFERKTANF